MTERKLATVAAGKELTDMQWGFVQALASGEHDLESAAIHAGFSERSALRQAYELLGKDHVKAAYVTLLSNRLAASAAGASNTLMELATKGRSEYVKLQAAQDILDRLGLRASEKVDHRISGEVSVSIDLG